MAINALQPILRGATGKELQFTGDFHAYWDQLGIPPGQFAERMAAWKALPQNAAWIDATEDADAADVVGGLWRNNEQGVWYDASDLSTMYQDAAGTLPVYAPGSGQVDPPVGRILDKSGRGNHAYQATTTSRPTLSARYNLLTGTESLATQSATVVATAYTLTTSGPGSVTLSGAASGTYTAGSRIVTCTAGTLTLTVSGSVTQADFRPANDGIGLPSYQRVVDANTYDTAGFPLYLRFDGVDDWLQTASVDFSGTDKLFATAALRKLSDSGAGVVIELSAVSNSNNGSFALLAPSGATASAAAFLRGDTALAATTAYRLASPLSCVLSGVFDIGSAAGSESKIRVNGAWGTPSGTDVGGGNFGSYPIYIGRRGGSSSPFNGRLWGVVMCGASTPGATIAKVERLLNQKARIY